MCASPDPHDIGPDPKLCLMVVCGVVVLAVLLSLSGCTNVRDLKHLPGLYRMVRSGL